MDQQFRLLLTNANREWVVALLLPLLLGITIVMMGYSIALVPKKLIWLPLVGSVAFFLGGIYIMRRLLSEAAVVIVTEDSLTVQYQKTGKKVAVLFSSVTECHSYSYEGIAFVRLTFKGGKKCFYGRTSSLAAF